MATLAKLLVKVGIDAGDVDSGAQAVTRSVDGLASRLDHVGSRMQGFGAKASVGVTLPLLGLGAAAISAASDLNESVNAIRVVFGPAAAKIEEFGQTSARTVGLSTRAFNELVTPVGAALLNVGFSQDEAADSSIRLAQRAADMASVFNTDVSTALEAIQAGLRGESDPLERFGVGLSEAAVNAKAMELGLAGSTGEIDAQDKAQARLALIMEQTERISGDFANTSGEVANQERIAKAEAENMAASFGQKLIPVKMRLIEIASGLLDRFMSLSPQMQNLILMGAGLAAALGPVVFMVGSVVRTISTTITIAGQLGRAIATVGPAFASMVAHAVTATARVAAQVALQIAQWVVLGVQALIHAAKVALAWIISMGPIALVVAAVAAAVFLIVKYWDEISAAVSAAVRWIIDFVKRNWPMILAILTGPIGIAVTLIVKHWDSIVRVTQAFVGAIVGFFQSLYRSVTGALGSFVGAVAGAIGSIIGVFRSIPGWVSSALSWLIGGIANIFRWAISSAVGVISWGVQTVLWYFANVPYWIWQKLSGLGRMLWDIGKAIMESLINGIKNGVGRLKDLVGGIAGSITSWKGPIEKDRKLLIPEGGAIMEGLMAGIDRALPGLRDQLRGVTGMIGHDMNANLGAHLSARVAVPAARDNRVTFDFTGADTEMGRALRRMVRVDGRGDVGEAFR